MARGPAIRDALKSGRKLLGGWVNMNSPIATEIMALAGFDVIMIDQEHGPGNNMDAIVQQQAIRAAGKSHALLRVHDNSTQLIKQALDTGIDGVMVPLVETAEGAAAVAAACRFPPLGVRGVAPGNVRAAGYGFEKDSFIANRGTDVFVISQVESAETVRNLREIGKVEGIDMLFIGRNDLASSIGKLADLNDPAAKEMREEAERLIKESGRFLGGIPGPADSALDMFKRGYDLVIAAADHALLRDGAVAAVKANAGR
jgi:4-hydroxy-2-oxoheptanedioate aldolase